MKIAINGFGRIGRHVFKVAFDRPEIDVVAINDITDAKTLAHLLKYDSIYGRYGKKVEVVENAIIVDGQRIKVLAERDPKQLPWKDMGVDVAVESTGIFRKRDQVAWHIEAGAKKVLLTVPAKDRVDRTIVLGVNDDDLQDGDLIVSNASCTTNCLAPVAKVLLDNFGIVEGLMTTIHAFTTDQNIHDAPHSDLRRARAASLSVIPTTTGAAKAVGIVIPELQGKLNGIAMRVPVPTGSIVDLTVKLEKDPSVEELNAAMQAAAEGKMKGILEYSTDPLVSADIIGSTYSSIFDSLSTLKIGQGFFKLLSWYDNEWGYSCRVVDLIARLVK
ncbi:MAG TPA: type I glyceraldehyde-3-phosphate dehydrogenase [Spirochaetales bacterium]|nr:type I glyceraldehyde-3-phosphate dehydrogenase [Spirochaetales bacterium]